MMKAGPLGAARPGDAFWDFSLRVYAAPGVPGECLSLQERLGLDVNVLLFAAYCGARLGIVLCARDVAEVLSVTQDWHVAVVRNLRSARIAMKRWSETGDDAVTAAAATLRLAVKQAELDAERIEHDLLARWAAGRVASAQSDPAAAVETNIRIVLDHYAATSGNSADRPAQLIAAALT